MRAHASRRTQFAPRNLLMQRTNDHDSSKLQFLGSLTHASPPTPPGVGGPGATALGFRQTTPNIVAESDGTGASRPSSAQLRSRIVATLSCSSRPLALAVPERRPWDSARRRQTLLPRATGQEHRGPLLRNCGAGSSRPSPAPAAPWRWRSRSDGPGIPPDDAKHCCRERRDRSIATLFCVVREVPWRWTATRHKRLARITAPDRLNPHAVAPPAGAHSSATLKQWTRRLLTV